MPPPRRHQKLLFQYPARRSANKADNDKIYNHTKSKTRPVISAKTRVAPLRNPVLNRKSIEAKTAPGIPATQPAFPAFMTPYRAMGPVTSPPTSEPKMWKNDMIFTVTNANRIIRMNPAMTPVKKFFYVLLHMKISAKQLK